MLNKFYLKMLCIACVPAIMINRNFSIIKEPNNDKLIEKLEHIIVRFDNVNVGLEKVDENIQKVIKSCKE